MDSIRFGILHQPVEYTFEDIVEVICRGVGVEELRQRVCDARVATFVSRLEALSVLTKFSAGIRYHLKIGIAFEKSRFGL